MTRLSTPLTYTVDDEAYDLVPVPARTPPQYRVVRTADAQVLGLVEQHGPEWVIPISGLGTLPTYAKISAVIRTLRDGAPGAAAPLDSPGALPPGPR